MAGMACCAQKTCGLLRNLMVALEAEVSSPAAGLCLLARWDRPGQGAAAPSGRGAEAAPAPLAALHEACPENRKNNQHRF